MGNMDLTNSQNENAKLAAGMGPDREIEATKDAALVADACTAACDGAASADAAALSAACSAPASTCATPSLTKQATAAGEDAGSAATAVGADADANAAVSNKNANATAVASDVDEAAPSETSNHETYNAPPPKRKGRWLDRLRSRWGAIPAEAGSGGATETPPETGPGLVPGAPPEDRLDGRTETPPPDFPGRAHQQDPNRLSDETQPKLDINPKEPDKVPTQSMKTSNKTNDMNEPKPIHQIQEPNKADAMDNLNQTNESEAMNLTDNGEGMFEANSAAAAPMGAEALVGNGPEGAAIAVADERMEGLPDDPASAEAIDSKAPIEMEQEPALEPMVCSAEAIGAPTDSEAPLETNLTNMATETNEAMNETKQEITNEADQMDNQGNTSGMKNEAVNAATTEGFEMTDSHEMNDPLNVAADEQETTMDAKNEDLQNEQMPAAGIDSITAESNEVSTGVATESNEVSAEANTDITVETVTEPASATATTPARAAAPARPGAAASTGTSKETHWLAQAAKDASLRDAEATGPSAASRVGVSYRSFTHRTPSRPLGNLTREASAAQAAANRAAATKATGAAVAARAAAAQAAGPDRPGQPDNTDPAAARLQRRDKRRRFGRKALASFMAVVLAIGLCPLPAFGDDGQIDGVTFNGTTASIEHQETTTTTVDEDGNTVTTNTSETTVTSDASDELTPEQQEANDESMQLMYSQILYNQKTKDKSSIDNLSGYKASEDSTLPLSAGIEAEKSANATAYFEGDAETTGSGPDAEPATDGNFTVVGSGTLAKPDHRFAGYATLGSSDDQADLAIPSGAKVTGWVWDSVVVNDEVIGYIDANGERQPLTDEQAILLAEAGESAAKAANASTEGIIARLANGNIYIAATDTTVTASNAPASCANPVVKLKDSKGTEENISVSARANAGSDELTGAATETHNISDRQDNRGSITFTAQWVAEANLTGVEPEAVEDNQQSEGEGDVAEGDATEGDSSDSATKGDGTADNNPQEGDNATEGEEGDSTEGDNATDGDTTDDTTTPATPTEAEEDADIVIPADVAAMDFSTQRILVGLASGDIAARDNDNVVSRGNNLFLLQYNSQDAARRAYIRYTTYQNVTFVAPDSAVTADAEGDSEDGEAAGEDGEDADPDSDAANNETSAMGDAPTDATNETTSVKADLESIEAEGGKLANESAGAAPQLIALIDSGAPWHANVLSRATALDDEELGDLNGHGTAMLEAILAQNPEAQLISIRALDAQGEGTAASIYAAIMQAVAAGATIINLSLSGAATEENAAIAQAVQAAREAGIEVIASAGNNNAPAQYFTPANAEGSFTVGAADAAKVQAALESGKQPAELTADDVRQATSNYGDAVDAYVIAESTSYAAARTSAWLAANAGEGWQQRLAASELTIGTLAEEPVEDIQQPQDEDSTITADDDEPLKGYAYALFQTSNKTLYFFRTDRIITNGTANESVLVNSQFAPCFNGNNIIGTVYANFENQTFGNNAAPWYGVRTQVERVKFLDRIRPTSTAYWFDEFTALQEFSTPYSEVREGFPEYNLLLDMSICTSMENMFNNCTKLNTVDMRGLDTKNVSNWRYFLSTNAALTYIYLNGLQTGYNADLSYMIYNNDSLVNLDMTGFDASHASNMTESFRGNDYLNSFKWPNANTSSVSTMYGLFRDNVRLTDVDVTGWDTARVTNMNYMFYNCGQLAKIDLSSFSTRSVTESMQYFFGYSNSGPDWRLRSIKFGPSFDYHPVNLTTGNRVTSIWLPYGSGSVSNTAYTGYWESDGYYTNDGDYVESPLIINSGWTMYVNGAAVGEYTGTMNREFHWQANQSAFAFISDKGDMKFFRSTTPFQDGDLVLSSDYYMGTSTFGADGWVYRIDESKMYTSAEQLPWNQSERDTRNPAYTGSDGKTYYAPVDVKTVNFFGQQILPVSTAHWFEGMTSLKTVTNLNSYMCTHETVDMTAMFKDCTSLMNISFGTRDQQFQTSSVRSMESMFENCESLPSLVLGEFKTPSVTSFRNMFKGCMRLQSISFVTANTVKGFVTDNATDLHGMFSGCERLQTLDISNFNLRYAEDLGDMFKDCNSMMRLTTGAKFSFYGLYKYDASRPQGDSLITDEAKMAKLPDYLGADESQIDPMGYYTGKWTVPAGNKTYWGHEILDYTGSMAGTFSWELNVTYAYAIYTPSDTTLTFFRSRTKGLAPNNTDATVEVNGEMKTGRLWWGYQDGSFKGFEAYDGMNTTYENTPGYAYVSSQGTLPPWASYQTSVTKVNFVNQIKPVSLAHWFYGFSNLYEVNINGNLDMSECVSMNSLFEGCNNLFYVDLQDLDTSKVTNMVNLFWNCQKLARADIGNWDTSSVLCFNDMFGYCYSLTELDFSNWDTSRAGGPIKHAGSDRYGFNRMFYDTPNLKKVTFGENFSVVGNGMTGDNRFILPGAPNNQQYTDKWIAPDGNAYTNAQLRDDYMINNNPAGVYTLQKKDQAYALLENNGRLQFFRDSTDKFYNGQSIVPSQSTKLASGTVAGTVFTGFEDTTEVPWINDALKVKTVYVQNTIQPVSMKEWFSGMANLTTFNAAAIASNARCIDTTLVTDMSYLFNGCTSLLTTSASSNLQTFVNYLDTRNVRTMRGMFSGCTGITQLSVTNMRTFWLEDATNMFSGCNKLESLTFRATNAAYHTTLFTTERVKAFTGMFSGCSKLSSLDLGYFSTNSATAMRNMFEGCTSMRTLTLSDRFSFRPAGVTSNSLRAVLPDAKQSTVYSGLWLTPAGTKLEAAAVTESYDGTMNGNFTWATGDNKAYAIAWNSTHPESDNNSYDTLTFFRSERVYPNNTQNTRVEFADGRHRTIVGRVFAPNSSTGVGFETYQNTTDYGNPYATGYHVSYTAPPWYSLRTQFSTVNFLDEIAPPAYGLLVLGLHRAAHCDQHEGEPGSVPVHQYACYVPSDQPFGLPGYERHGCEQREDHAELVPYRYRPDRGEPERMGYLQLPPVLLHLL